MTLSSSHISSNQRSRLRRRPSASSTSPQFKSLQAILLCVLFCVVLLTIGGDVLYVEEVIMQEEPWLPYDVPLDPLLREIDSYPEHEDSIVISGLFLNTGVDATKQMFELMNTTVSYFRESTVLLLENDSTDGTTQALIDICDDEANQAVCINLRFKNRLPHFQTDVAEKSHNDAFGQRRFSRMSWYRNMVLDRVKRMPDTDYFAFCDTDLLFKEPWYPTKEEVAEEFARTGLGEPPNFGGVAHAWKAPSVVRAIHRANEQEPDWSVLCFYGTLSERSSVYDMLAFRLSDQTPIPDMAKRYQPTWSREDWNFHLSAKSIENDKTNDKELHLAMFVFDYAKDSPLIPVRSCFGGLAIYKLSKLQESGCEYSEQAKDCEHVTLHECLFEQYPDTIFMDPQSRLNYDDFAPRD